MVQAPRGPLIHHYRIENGLIARAEFVIPTVHNMLAIERALRVAAERVDMELERAVRRVVRDTSSLYMPGLLHSPPMRRSRVTLFRWE